jgi:hypothetical protein
MENLKLGQIIEGPQNRDAIHVAIAPVEAAHHLDVGQHVGLDVDGRATAHAALIGVVDPFLKAAVTPRQKFWLFLYPGTVTSLRHEWTHPAFTAQEGVPGVTKDAEEAKIAESWAWIDAFAARLDQTRNRLMSAAESYREYGDYTRDDSEAYKEHWDEFETFWTHYEIVKGVKVEDKSSFFTCSC